MGRASSSSSSDSSSSSSSSDARRREKKRKREEKKHKHKRKSESKKRQKSDRADPDDPDRLEKKRLKEAKRFLKRQRRAADVALVPSAAAAKPKKSKTEKKKDEKKPPERPPAPLTAAQEAAARVAAARAAALAEDDALVHLGSSREDILGFRNGRNGADGVSGGGDDTKGDSKRFRRETAERLEDAVPKASGREALLEKRAAVRFSNREMADAKEDMMFSAAGWGGGNEMGGGGGDEFKAALASGRRAKDARDRRRGVDPSAVALRARAHRQGELQTMSGFHDLVGGLGEGERIQIPKRYYSAL